MAEKSNPISSPKAGTVVFVTVRKLSVPMLLLKYDGKGLWMCCKVSTNVQEASGNDLILRDHPAFQASVVIEAWNGLHLHVEDLPADFYPALTKQELAWVWELLKAHQNNESVPVSLRFLTGKPFSYEDDPRFDHYYKEMGIVEMIRLKFHEGYVF